MSNEREDSVSEDTPVLTRPERLRLHTLGYKDEHIDRMGVPRCKTVLATAEPRPGSKAAIRKANKRNRAAGLPQVSEAHSDEAIKERNADPAKATPGVAVTLDEFTSKCLRGDDPLDAIILAHQEKFPGMRFRLINPELPKMAGTQFQQVYDENRKPIGEGGMMLGYMPESVYQEEYVEPNLDRAAKMVGQVRNPRPIEVEKGEERDGDLSLSGEAAQLAPIAPGGGLKVRRSVYSKA